MDTRSALLALCEENPQNKVSAKQNFYSFFVLIVSLDMLLNKQQTGSCSDVKHPLAPSWHTFNLNFMITLTQTVNNGFLDHDVIEYWDYDNLFRHD